VLLAKCKQGSDMAELPRKILVDEKNIHVVVTPTMSFVY
jgi:hypothetical protein